MDEADLNELVRQFLEEKISRSEFTDRFESLSVPDQQLILEFLHRTGVSDPGQSSRDTGSKK